MLVYSSICIRICICICIYTYVDGVCIGARNVTEILESRYSVVFTYIHGSDIKNRL